MLHPYLAAALSHPPTALWRGTVVAVKSMLLPASMLGSEQRDRMALMEVGWARPGGPVSWQLWVRSYTALCWRHGAYGGGFSPVVVRGC